MINLMKCSSLQVKSADLQKYLKDKDQKWLKVTAPNLAYKTSTNSLHYIWSEKQGDIL